MLTAPAGLMIYVATRPVDFRKGADGLTLCEGGAGPRSEEERGSRLPCEARRSGEGCRLGWQWPCAVLGSGLRAAASSGHLLLTA